MNVPSGCRLGLCLVLGAAVSVFLGQDAGFDLKNYHLYNAFAFIGWRYDIDYFPPAMQAYFNPLADLPYYVLSMGPLAPYPRALAALQGLYFGVLLYLAWKLNETVLPPASALVATMIGATAVGIVSEIGTTFNDIQISALVVGAMVLLMNDRRRCWRPLAAGMAFGAAAAIKLYGAYYAVAAVVALLIVYRRKAVRPVALATLGGGIAFLILHGWWAWWTWHKTGNPVFPYFNALFQSPLFPAENYSANFEGWELHQLIVAPLRWAFLQRGTVTELQFRDARGIVGLVAALGVALVLPSPGRWSSPAERRKVAFLLVFTGLSYLLWLWQFRLLRFGMPLELACGTMTMIALGVVTRAVPLLRKRAAFSGTVVLAVLLSSTVYMDWGRAPYGDRVFGAASEHLPLPPNSLVLIAGQPTAYVLPLIDAPGMRAIGISYMSSSSPHVAAEVANRVLAHEGPIFTVRTGAARPVRSPGLTLSLSDCMPLSTGLETLQLCRVLGAPETK